MKTPFPEYDADLVAGIEEHLRLDMQTRIVSTQTDDDTGLICTRACGADDRTYNRPMFQVIPSGVYSGTSRAGDSMACPCADFAYTWKCDEHYELEWDSMEGWLRPREETDDQVPQAPGLQIPDDLLRLEAIRQLITHRPIGCRCYLCNPVNMLTEDPNRGRQGYRYSFAQDRWVPATRRIEVRCETADGLATFWIEAQSDERA